MLVNEGILTWPIDIERYPKFLRELVAKEEVFRNLADLTMRANENNNIGKRASGSDHSMLPRRGSLRV